MKQEDEDSKDTLSELPSEEAKPPTEPKEGELGTIADISEDEDDVVHKRRVKSPSPTFKEFI